jgi:hypothetical protein
LGKPGRGRQGPCYCAGSSTLEAGDAAFEVLELTDVCHDRDETRSTGDPDIHGVDASMITLSEQPYWSVAVAVAEFLRDDPRD